MIKFYSYYNHGGYKDMYLGATSDSFAHKYYLPLLSAYEEELKNAYDAETERYIAKCSSLPKIILLNDSTKCINYPDEAKRMISHAGYKLIFRSASNGVTILSLRDISGTKDSFGRSAPFSFLAVADSSDRSDLSIIAEHMRSNILEWEVFLSSLFVYDLDVNGLRFDIGKLVQKWQSVCETSIQDIDYKSYNRKVHLVVILHSKDLALCLKEQNLSRDDINVVYDIQGNKTVLDTYWDTDGYNEDSSYGEYNSELLIERIKKLERRVTILERKLMNL